MSLAKQPEIDEALESKQRFKGFINDAPNALNIVNQRIDDEIARATGVENQLRTDLTTETNARTAADTQLSSDIEELGNNINEQIQSIDTDITALEQRVTALEQKVNTEAQA